MSQAKASPDQTRYRPLAKRPEWLEKCCSTSLERCFTRLNWHAKPDIRPGTPSKSFRTNNVASNATLEATYNLFSAAIVDFAHTFSDYICADSVGTASFLNERVSNSANAHREFRPAQSRWPQGQRCPPFIRDVDWHPCLSAKTGSKPARTEA